MGKRAQRIPSWPGVIHSNKGRIHLRRPTCDILTIRLRRSGGPYIPVWRHNWSISAHVQGVASLSASMRILVRRLESRPRRSAFLTEARARDGWPADEDRIVARLHGSRKLSFRIVPRHSAESRMLSEILQASGVAAVNAAQDAEKNCTCD